MVTITLKENYLLTYVQCKSGKHPNLEVLMPISQVIPFILQEQICPSCYAKDADIVRKCTEPYIVQIEDMSNSISAKDTHFNNFPVEKILYTVNCERDGLSLFFPERMKWRDNLKIRMCPACGSEKYKIKGKFDVRLILTPKSMIPG